MKKSVFYILIISSLASYAQLEYKPQKGNLTTEMQLSLFNINAKIDLENETVDYSTGPLSISGLRLRYFFSDRLALRTTLGLKFDHGKSVSEIDRTVHTCGYYDCERYEITGEKTEKFSNTSFSVAPGLEYHFGEFERMSLYIGGELFFGMTTTKSTMEEKTEAMVYLAYSDQFWGTERIEKNSEMKNCKSMRYYNGYDYVYGYKQNAPMTFGVNILLGFDYYIYKGLYMGAELGLGYSYKTLLKGHYKENYTKTRKPKTGKEKTVDVSDEVKLKDDISSGSLSFIYNPMIRVGWKF